MAPKREIVDLAGAGSRSRGGGGGRGKRRHGMVRHCCVLQKHRRHKRDGCMMMRKRKKSDLKLKWGKKIEGLEKLMLNVSEAGKRIVLCFHEEHEDDSWGYVVRTITLEELFDMRKQQEEISQLEALASEASPDVPDFPGCGLFSDKIIFAGGYDHTQTGDSAEHYNRNYYSIDLSSSNSRIIKFDSPQANLLEGKMEPIIVELNGKLHILSSKLVGHPLSPSFEVFDPEVNKWQGLPQPPFLQPQSEYFIQGMGYFSYLIVGTKLFVSHEQCPVFCFDAAFPDQKWRLVPTMCAGGPFRFCCRALVLDLPDDNNNKNQKKKVIFGYHINTMRVGIYLYEDEEKGQESMKRIGLVKLPVSMFPRGWEGPGACDIVHIGDNKGCFIITQFLQRDMGSTPGIHYKRGIALPFQFHVDASKVDSDDYKNCFTLQFMAPRMFGYASSPSTLPFSPTLGCFLL